MGPNQLQGYAVTLPFALEIIERCSGPVDVTLPSIRLLVERLGTGQEAMYARWYPGVKSGPGGDRGYVDTLCRCLSEDGILNRSEGPLFDTYRLTPEGKQIYARIVRQQDDSLDEE